METTNQPSVVEIERLERKAVLSLIQVNNGLTFGSILDLSEVPAKRLWHLLNQLLAYDKIKTEIVYQDEKPVVYYKLILK